MNRVESLTQIIVFGEHREQAFSHLSKCRRDGDTESVDISDSILALVLEKYLSGCISADDLEEWANFVECRDDIDCGKNEGYIYALSNPELMGEISTENINKMLTLLIS